MRETENNNTDTGQEGGYTDVTEDTDRELRERRRQRRLRRQKRERRKKLMILGATGIITTRSSGWGSKGDCRFYQSQRHTVRHLL